MDRGIPTEHTLETMREGRYLLRPNMTSEDPAALWRNDMQITEIEQASNQCVVIS